MLDLLLTLPTAFQPLYGRGSDIFGRKAATLFASIVFLIGSLACGLSNTFGQLIAARALAGIGAGGLVRVNRCCKSLSDFLRADHHEQHRYVGFDSA